MNKRQRLNTPTRFTLSEIEAQCKNAIIKAKPVLQPAPVRPVR